MRIVVPVKPLADAKSRLAVSLSQPERATLMCGLLDRVVAAGRAVAPVSVVTADEVVALRARAMGAAVIDERRVAGLDAAARLAVEHLRREGETMVLILAADLPDVTSDALRAMLGFTRPDAVVMGPSRDGGTNALALPIEADFRFGYGPDSFERHCREGRRLGLEVIIHDTPALSVDLDRPEDLAGYRALWAA